MYVMLEEPKQVTARRLLATMWDQVIRIQERLDTARGTPSLVGKTRALLDDVHAMVGPLKGMIQEVDALVDQILPMNAGQ